MTTPTDEGMTGIVNTSFTFTIPGRLPGMNDIIQQGRRSWRAGAKLKRSTTALCGWHILAAQVPKFDKKVNVHFAWYEPNNRRDSDNVAAGSKFILDALVETGKIPNDSRKWVDHITNVVTVDKKNPRVEVTIKETGV